MGLSFEGAVRSCELKIPLRLVQLNLKVDIIFVAEQLVEFLLIGSMRALNFSDELRAARSSFRLFL